METLEYLIQQDVNNYYIPLKDQARRNIYIIDTCQLVICLVTAIMMHFILRNAYKERVHLFKSLTVIEEEEIYLIQKNLNDHKEQIKNN